MLALAMLLAVGDVLIVRENEVPYVAREESDGTVRFVFSGDRETGDPLAATIDPETGDLWILTRFALVHEDIRIALPLPALEPNVLASVTARDGTAVAEFATGNIRRLSFVHERAVVARLTVECPRRGTIDFEGWTALVDESCLVIRADGIGVRFRRLPPDRSPGPSPQTRNQPKGGSLVDSGLNGLLVGLWQCFENRR